MHTHVKHWHAASRTGTKLQVLAPKLKYWNLASSTDTKLQMLAPSLKHRASSLINGMVFFTAGEGHS